MYKIDLHTHSSYSHDGGIKPQQYQNLLEKKILDFIAITDHDNIDLALAMHATLGEKIIVGQEITTTSGEIIGLFLKKKVSENQTIIDAISDIRNQDGLVYIPHPFETVRSGINEKILNTIKTEIDIVEIHNGRAFFQNKGPKAATWTALNFKVGAVSSDAHGVKGIGHSYSKINNTPNRYNLVSELASAQYTITRPSIRAILYPKANSLKRKVSLK